MSLNIKKIVPKSPKKVIFYVIIATIIGYLACPLSVQLQPVDWWTDYDMIWYADDFSTSRYKDDADIAENVFKCQLGLCGSGTGQMYGRLVYTFTTDWTMEKGRLGAVAESESQTCAIDCYIDNQPAGSFNGSKEMLFCTADNLPSIDDPRQWVVISDPHKVQVKFIFYSNSSSGEKDLVLKQIEFSARVHGDVPGDETGNGSLVGYVFDSQTNNRIENAQVILGNHSVKTNSQGYYRIDGIKPDTYTVKTSKSGYEDAENVVTISECPNDFGCNQLDVYLNPTASTTRSLCTLEGNITHEDGYPIEGAQICLTYHRQLGELYKTVSDSEGYYKITGIEPKMYSFGVLAKNCEPHFVTDMEMVTNKRYDIEMGDGVSYPVPPGRGINSESETGYNYHPPAPPDYQTYIPPIREAAPSNYPSEGPRYSNPTASAPSDGADYVPPPPGYTKSPPVLQQTPPSNPLERAISGWQSIFIKVARFARRLVP